jgi:hypothetical protein
MNTEEFKWGVNWQQVLKSLIEDHQDVQGEEARQVRHFFLLFLMGDGSWTEWSLVFYTVPY